MSASKGSANSSGGRPKAGMRPHPTDVVSLVFGLVFLGGAGLWMVYLVSDLTLPLGWLFAVTLIAIGAIGLFAAVRPGRRGGGSNPPSR